ncbi:hypothetical protein A7K94_0214185 [Modestobacter sp. VKM Ac-2676]|nr:hypothetical protein A7K94_0214185 [Modestobacter sp. VKM Ac-2676]
MWPWILLAALIAALLIWWLVAEFTGDEDVDPSAGTAVTETTVATETEATATATATATPSPDAADGPGLGVVLIGDLDALAPDVDLSESVGEPVEANSVQVQAVVADEAFFVGPEPGQTIMVRLQPFGGAGDEESPFQVQEGETVSFSGTLEEIDEEFLSSLQLYMPADELETGDYYVQASEITPGG